jgi:alpha-1,3-rhamnosyl/mannosyltransferase
MISVSDPAVAPPRSKPPQGQPTGNGRRLRVGIDARPLNTHHVRGMGKALYQLLREGVERDDVEFVLFGDEPTAPMQCPEHSRIQSQVWEVPGHRFHSWEQVGLPWRAQRAECDVLHYFGTWCSWWQPLPTIVTIHDTLMWDEEQPTVLLEHVLPAAYHRAAAIITDSESSRRDILRRWPNLAAKTDVVRFGISRGYTQTNIPLVSPTLEALGVRGPYLLYLGGQVPRKRLDWAVRVWAALEQPNLTLVVCGLEREKIAEWRARVPEAVRDRFVCLEFVSETEMPSIYAGAAALLYPTLYEGFGFPALESQAVGRPVLMSALGSLQELVGPGTVILPPDDFGAWVASCRRILATPAAPDAEARAWARRFSWANAYAEVHSVYTRAARQRC